MKQNKIRVHHPFIIFYENSTSLLILLDRVNYFYTGIGIFFDCVPLIVIFSINTNSHISNGYFVFFVG